MSDSPFLELPQESWLRSNQLAFAVYDRFPVSPGHVLVLTKRLVPTWFDASPEEQLALMSLVNEVKQYLDATLQPQPAGYNVGFNAGAAAGQTVMHVHIHVIPRYIGDMPDPRGGVRHVIPSKGNYLSESNPEPANPSPAQLQLVTGHPQSRLWDQLSSRLIGATSVDILAAFVQRSGLDVIKERLFQLLRQPSSIRILVSDYLFISDPLALKRLCDWQQLVANNDEFHGQLQARLVEKDKLPTSPSRSIPRLGESSTASRASSRWAAATYHDQPWIPVPNGTCFPRRPRQTNCPLMTRSRPSSMRCGIWRRRLIPKSLRHMHSTQKLTESCISNQRVKIRGLVPDPRPWQHAALKSVTRDP